MLLPGANPDTRCYSHGGKAFRLPHYVSHSFSAFLYSHSAYAPPLLSLSTSLSLSLLLSLSLSLSVTVVDSRSLMLYFALSLSL